MNYIQFAKKLIRFTDSKQAAKLIDKDQRNYKTGAYDSVDSVKMEKGKIVVRYTSGSGSLVYEYRTYYSINGDKVSHAYNGPVS